VFVLTFMLKRILMQQYNLLRVTTDNILHKQLAQAFCEDNAYKTIFHHL